MTDGGSNYALMDGSISGDEWNSVPVLPDVNNWHSKHSSSSNDWKDESYTKYDSESNGNNGEGAILDILMTASYMKSKMLYEYGRLLKTSKVSEEAKNNLKFPIHTFSVDTPGTTWQKPRIYATMDPEHYFISGYEDSNWIEKDENTGKVLFDHSKDIANAYTAWENWINAPEGGSSTTNVGASYSGTGNLSGGNLTFKLNKLQAGGKDGVTNADVIKNINYNDSFSDIGTSDLTEKFIGLIDDLDNPMFSPISGGNDLGVDDSVTYMDPIGQYMEVKDVKNVLLFGDLHGVTKTAVYNWKFNDDYVKNHDRTGQDFQPGWYRGDSGVDAEQDLDIYPGDCKSNEEAWAAGWEYRLNTATVADFVPSLGKQVNVADPEDKVKLTDYTFYRLTDENRNDLHMNPAYGETLPAGAQYDKDGAHLNYPGVYALSDMRIWVEDTGDYNDTLVSEPGVESSSNFDQALWVNLPVNMLPLRKVTITQDSGSGGTEWKYESNQEHSSDKAHKASFPMRVFYTVGVSGEALENGRINVAGALSAQYIEQNKITTTAAQNARNLSMGDIEFFSNWYNPENRYDDYAITDTDYSYGDPVITFSPSDDNRYYIFQKPLPLYNTAYVWVPENKLSDDDKETYKDDIIKQYGGLWKKVGLQEDLTGASDARTFDPADFGGRLICQDLEPTDPDPDNVSKTNQTNMWAALKDKDIGPKSGSESAPELAPVEDGDIVLLKKHSLTDVTRPSDEEIKGGTKEDPFASDSYYYMPIDFWSNSGDNAEQSQYVVARKGSEFGSAYKSSHINNGDMLCWYDKSGEYDQIYPYLSYTDTGDNSRGQKYIGVELESDGKYKYADSGVPTDATGSDFAKTHKEMLENGDWVVAAKPGGIRVGALAQAVGEKTRTMHQGDGTVVGGDEYTAYDEYKNERFPEAKSDFAVGYYAGNITRTANNYYVPTLSVNSGLDTDRDVIVNTYLGNNGRLVVQDTTVLATKLVEPPEGEAFTASELDDINKEDFQFQIYVNKYDGPMDALVVRYNNGTWQRQFHYIDLKLDPKLFLQTKDGQKAMFDDKGIRITGSPENYTYVDNGEKYTGTVYYAYLGENSNAEDIGVGNMNFRVYHNTSADEDETQNVSPEDVTTERDSESEKATFYANKVYLVPQGNYDTFDTNRPAGNQLEKFELMTIDPNVSDTTDVYFDTPYLTDSSYLTERVVFGKVSADGDAKALEDKDLYDQIIPLGDRSDYFNKDNGNTENSEIAKYTAQFTLKHGEGLLFNGIPSNTVYRITEKLTAEQMQKGYSLKEAGHNQQVGSTSTYRPGAQSIPVYYNTDPDKEPHPTYRWYGGGAYPSDYDNNETEKGLMWALSKNGTPNNDSFLYYEPFHHTNALVWDAYSTMDAAARGDNHHQPSNVDDGTSTFWLWDEGSKTSTNTGQPHIVGDNPSCKPLEQGGADEDIGGGKVRHYFFKDGELRDVHYEGEGSGYIRNIGRYITSPTVHFGVEGETETTANQSMETYKQNTEYTGVYSVFGNTGTYEESANFINTISNDKTETQINGKDVTASEDDKNLYPGIQEGDTITYEIKWANSTADKARVVITDQLDKGVDFVSATCVDSKGNKYTGKYYKTQKAANDALEAIYGDKKNVKVDSGHVVIVDLPDRAAGETGKVILTVKVNKDAIEWWDYDGDGVADAPAGSPPDPDFMVRNRATVRVADNAFTTNTVKNPVGEPEKTETSIYHEGGEYGGTKGTEDVGEDHGNYDLGKDGKYHAPLVYVGDTITYEVTWRNYENKDATVSIRDPLDKNVEFVSAAFDPADCDDGNGGKLTTPPAQTLDAKKDKSSTDTSAKEGGTVSYGALGTDTRPVIAYNADDHEVTWNLGEQPSGASGKVTLTVKVLDTATPVGYVDNTAYVQVNGDPEQKTDIVENPTPHQSKTEVTPGDGVMVELGKPITYEINWQNYKPDRARIVIMDTLDPGVDYVRSDNNGKYYDKAGSTITVDKETVVIPVHTVVWDLGEQAPNKEGKVSLIVKPNKNAKIEYTYNTNADGLDKGSDEDYEVLDQARVKVGNDAFLKTEIVENPVPDKTETDIDYAEDTMTDDHSVTLEAKAGEDNTLTGPTVFVGDKVTYKIHWKNGHDKKADVFITDKLDPGVEYNDADQKEPKGTYDKETHTVGWVLKDQAPEAEGDVTVAVRITDKATEAGKVDNQAIVRVGNDPAVNTDIIENPTPKVEKIETKPGEGQQVMPGDEIDYEVTWRNYHEEPADVTVTDRLDPGVDFTEASFDGVTLSAAMEGEEPTEQYADLEITMQKGDTDDEITIRLELTAPEGKELADSYKWENITTKATGEWTASSNEIKLKAGEKVTVKDLPVGTGYKLVGDDGSEIATGTIASGGSLTELKAVSKARAVDGMEKITDTPQETKPTAAGASDETTPSETSEDISDTGSESGPDYEIELVKNEASGTDTIDTQKKIAVPVTDKIKAQDADGNIIIEYDPDTRTITWTLKKRPPLDEGKVSFKVTVNEDAEKFWSYDDPTAGPDPDKNDDRVRNQAGVRVGTDPMVKTRIIENPTKPQKTEVEINDTDVSRDVVWDDDYNGFDAPEVNVGDRVTYHITWQNNVVDKNGKMTVADIVITDELDPGVDYVSSDPKASYNSKTHTVTWKLGKKAPRERGIVSLTVRVNKKAVRPGQIVNDAVVKVGNNSQQTDKVRNPVGTDGALMVSKIVTGTKGDVNKYFHFTVTLSDTALNGGYGDMMFTGGTAAFTLKHDESAVASGLPLGITYEVVEAEADKDGYATSMSGETGEIPEGDMAKAEFVNAKGVTTPPPPEGSERQGGDYGGAPQTGDVSSSMLLWFAMLLCSLSMTVISAVLLSDRRLRRISF